MHCHHFGPILGPILVCLLLAAWTGALQYPVLLESRTLSVVPPLVFDVLHTYAHLIDISYCVSSTNKISEPFECDLECSQAFPDMELVYQWHFQNTVAGYIAHSNDTLLIVLRGTRSAPDTYTDLQVDTVEYENTHLNLLNCVSCRVHAGFYDAYTATLRVISPYVDEVLKEYQHQGYNPQIKIMGHSLGGAVALLLALNYVDEGIPNIQCVTMGQPLVGNKQFTSWADLSLKSFDPIHQRLFWRVIHLGDVVATMPNKHITIRTESKRKYWFLPPFFQPHAPELVLDTYCQFDNQIYINCSSHDYNPTPSEVVDCWTGSNKACIAGDFPGIGNPKIPVSYDSHLAYFRRMGFCGIKI